MPMPTPTPTLLLTRPGRRSPLRVRGNGTNQASAAAASRNGGALRPRAEKTRGTGLGGGFHERLARGVYRALQGRRCCCTRGVGVEGGRDSWGGHRRHRCRRLGSRSGRGRVGGGSFRGAGGRATVQVRVTQYATPFRASLHHSRTWERRVFGSKFPRHITQPFFIFMKLAVRDTTCLTLRKRKKKVEPGPKQEFFCITYQHLRHGEKKGSN